MKSFLLAATGLVALGLVPAVAADLPARIYTKAPPVAAVYDWTGFYVGVNGTAGWSYANWDWAPPFVPFADGSSRSYGFFGGAQVGYNIQAGAFVFGVEAQADWGDLGGWNGSLLNIANSNRTKTDAFGLFTGRIGYAMNNALFYAKGGAAVVHDNYDVFDTGTLAPLASASATRWGAVAGGGIEVAFSENVSVAVEYDHAFFGRRTVDFAPAGIATYAVQRDLDLVSFRLNYRFGGGGRL